MIYVLLFIVGGGGGGFAADFNSQEACEAARAAFVAEAGTHQTISICVPKG